MSRYASETTVTVERSKTEIERLLQRYGATGFMYAWHGPHQVVAFEMRDRHVRFALPMPAREEFDRAESGRKRTESAAQSAYEQACRQRWRALVLVVKAKLEAVAAGIVAFEDEFLAHTVTPNGQTVGEWLRPQLEQVYNTGRMPPLLPGIKEES